MLLLLVGSQLPQACHWHTPGWIANFIILSLFLRTFSGHCSFLSQLWAALEQKPIETNAQIAQILQNLKLAWDSHNFTMLSFRKYSEPSYHPHLLGDFCDQLQINSYLSPSLLLGQPNQHGWHSYLWPETRCLNDSCVHPKACSFRTLAHPFKNGSDLVHIQFRYIFSALVYDVIVNLKIFLGQPFLLQKQQCSRVPKWNQ